MRRARRGLALLLLSALLWPSLALFAADQATEEALVFGVFPRRNVKETLRAFRPMARHLREALGRPVQLATGKDFAEFWTGVEQRRYDLVHFNQYHYMIAHQRFGYEVLLRSVEYGYDTIAGSIIVRKDSGIETAQALKGQKIVFGGGPKAMMSYIAAAHLLLKAGLKPGDYTRAFAINPPNAVSATFHHQSAAAGAGDTVLLFESLNHQIDTAQMRYLLRGERLAHLPWAVKKEMPDALHQRIRDILAQLDQSPPGREVLRRAQLTGLIPAQDSDYNPHRRIVYEVLGEKY